LLLGERERRNRNAELDVADLVALEQDRAADVDEVVGHAGAEIE
jgi:hypothetical protein